MAQAFANIYGAGKIVAYSAGSNPSGIINPKAISAMHELGYDLKKHSSKSINDIPKQKYDYVITMGCGDECPFIEAGKREDWEIADPKNIAKEEFRKVRDLIKNKVIKLIDEL